jgi:hypothetical protein
LFEALELSTAAQRDVLTVVISTQAASDGDLLSTLIDDGIAGNDPRTIVSLYSAPKDADPFAEATIRLANPSYDVLDGDLSLQRSQGRRPVR